MACEVREVDGGQVEVRQVQARHVEGGEVDVGQIHPGKVHARQVHLHLIGVDLEGRREFRFVDCKEGGHVEATGLALLVVCQFFEGLAGENIDVGLGTLSLDNRAGAGLFDDLIGQGGSIGDALTQCPTLVGVGLNDSGDGQLLTVVHELLHVVGV